MKDKSTTSAKKATLDRSLTGWIRESNLIEGIDDPKEDARCLRAWRQLQRKPWTVTTLLWLHGYIMKVLNPRIGGYWRRCSVQVGSYVAPHWSEVPRKIAVWMWDAEFSHKLGQGYAGDKIKHDHICFEGIHPFEDGNGRTGRMLMNWQRRKAKLEPLLIKASERRSYYEWFRN